LNLELSQDIPSSDLVDQGEEDTWDTVREASEKSRSPAPTTEATVPEAAQQAAVVDEPRASTEERRPESSSTARAVEPGEPTSRKKHPLRLELLILPTYLALRS
jgi:hypothetical protein